MTANVLRAHADGYTFRHELIREAVHEDLLPGEHGRLHSRFAEAIDADPSLVPPGRAAIEMAHHWHAAHDSVWALIGAWQAAAQAGRAVAPAERLSLLARVLELWDQVPDAAERIGADHVRVLEEATCAAQEAGEFERGIALASSALKELDPSASPVRVAQLLETRGHFKMNLGRKEFHDDFSAALAIVPADAPAARIPILLAAARCVPVVAVERSYAEEALALARQAGDEANEANALLTLAMFRAGVGQQSDVGSDPMELIAQARAMAERAGAHDLLAKAAINESHLLEGAGEHELAVEAARRGIAGQDERYMARASRSLLALNQVEPLFALGRWDEALAVAEGARDFQFTSLPLHRSMLAVFTGRIALARGETGAAAEAAATAAELLRGSPQRGPVPASARPAGDRAAAGHGRAGRRAGGRVAGRRGLRAVRRQPAVRLAAAGWRGRGLPGGRPGRAAPGRGRRPGGPAAHDRGEAGDVRPGPGGQPGDLRRGRRPGAAALSGLPVAGELLAAWDEAAAAWEAVSEPYPRAQALLHAAEAALAGGDRDGAADRLREAAALAAGLGAGRSRRRSRCWPGGPGSCWALPPRPVRARLGLTGRELEVLRLVAAGRSNREIANELFISPKTASVHVSNILGKLGAASRGEAAAKAHALRLVDPAL